MKRLGKNGLALAVLLAILCSCLSTGLPSARAEDLIESEERTDAPTTEENGEAEHLPVEKAPSEEEHLRDNMLLYRRRYPTGALSDR